jgi:hypothetical protein
MGNGWDAGIGDAYQRRSKSKAARNLALPRWTSYASRLTPVVGLAVTGSAVLVVGIALDEVILPHVQRRMPARHTIETQML